MVLVSDYSPPVTDLCNRPGPLAHVRHPVVPNLIIEDPLYPQKTGNILLTQVDFKTDMWQDEYGYMWSGNGYRPSLVNDVPLPIQEPDNYSKWSGYNDRWHSEFDSYLEQQKEKAISTMLEVYPNYDIIKPISKD